MPKGISTDRDGNPRFEGDPCTPDTGNPDGLSPFVDMEPYEFQPPCPSDLDCSGLISGAGLGLLLGARGPCR